MARVILRTSPACRLAMVAHSAPRELLLLGGGNGSRPGATAVARMLDDVRRRLAAPAADWRTQYALGLWGLRAAIVAAVGLWPRPECREPLGAAFGILQELSARAVSYAAPELLPNASDAELDALMRDLAWAADSAAGFAHCAALVLRGVLCACAPQPLGSHASERASELLLAWLQPGGFEDYAENYAENYAESLLLAMRTVLVRLGVAHIVIPGVMGSSAWRSADPSNCAQLVAAASLSPGACCCNSHSAAAHFDRLVAERMPALLAEPAPLRLDP